MKEYIDRKNLLKNLNRFAPEKYDALVNDLILKEPVAIVQCKDCKYYTCGYGSYHGLCDMHCNGVGKNEVMKSDDYCSYGEKR